MMFLSTVYYAWLAYRLAKRTGRRRRVRAALGRERAAHVRRHVRDHAADPGQDQRPHQSLGGGARLGVLPELHPDDRRLHRALHPQDHAARRAAGHACGRVGRLHLHAPGDGDLHDAGHRPRLARHHPGGLVRRRALSARHPGGPRRHRGRHADRLGLDRDRLQRRRHEPLQARWARSPTSASRCRCRRSITCSPGSSSWPSSSSPQFPSASTTWSRRWTTSRARKRPATPTRRRRCSPPTAW